MRMRLLFESLSGIVSVVTRIAAIKTKQPCSRNDPDRLARRVAPKARYARPAQKDPSMNDTMAMRQRSHCRRLLPTGRWEAPRARNMVFPVSLSHYFGAFQDQWAY